MGESRPQELWQKVDLVSEVIRPTGMPVQWHLVGHLQRNKVRRTLPLVSMIHSVDSERLLAAIDEEAKATQVGSEEANRRPPVKVLLEVNTSGEAAKHGLAPEEVEPLLAKAPQYGDAAVCGLMTMAALEGGEEGAGATSRRCGS